MIDFNFVSLMSEELSFCYLVELIYHVCLGQVFLGGAMDEANCERANKKSTFGKLCKWAFFFFLFL